MVTLLFKNSKVKLTSKITEFSLKNQLIRNDFALIFIQITKNRKMFKLLWTLALLTATSSAINLDRDYSDDMFLGMACSTTRGQGLADASQRKRNRCMDQQVRTRDILSTRAAAAPQRMREYWVDLNAARRR